MGERVIPLKVLGHWQNARVHVRGGDLFIDIPAELIQAVETDHPHRSGVKYGYQLMLEWQRLLPILDPASYVGRAAPDAAARQERLERAADLIRRGQFPGGLATPDEQVALLRAGIDDAIQALSHLLKQTGKHDLDDIIRRVVTNVVPRLHAVKRGEDPWAEDYDG